MPPSAEAPPRPETKLPRRLALTGSDFAGLRPRLRVQEGDRVTAGQVLFTDRRHEAIRVTAPLGGHVESVSYGPRRSLGLLVLRLEEGTPEPNERGLPETSRQAMLDHGLWPVFRTRPYGRMPPPEGRPEAIFVAVTRAVAPDAARLAKGIGHLLDLTEGKVHLCQGIGPALVPAETFARLRVHRLRGEEGRLALAIHRHHSVADGGEVWTIEAQDVAALAELMRQGHADPFRLVSLDGPRAARPRVLRTLPGANLPELLEGEVLEPGRPFRILAGGAERESEWLRRGDAHVTLVGPGRARARQRSPIVPFAALEGLLPRGIHPVPLLRALSIGDAETARRLGCLDLLEEDLAPLSRRCASGAAYGPLLRQVLDELEEG